MFKFCGFDMDGTFINSLVDIADAMNRSLEKLGYPTYKEDDYKQMVGSGMRVLCERALPEADKCEIDKLVELYNADYTKNCCVKTAPYAGMQELVLNLKKYDIKSAILSNKPHTQATEIANAIIPEGTFEMILGQSDRFPAKPAPDSLLYLMDKFGVSKEDTVYIGDSDIDVKLGKAAGVYTIGVSWGFRGEAELLSAGADIVAHSAEELESLILQNR